MDIIITGRHFDVTPALRQYAEGKLTRLERHFDGITGINLIFAIEKLNQIAEATVVLAGNKIHATSESEDMYTTLDNLVDILDRKIIKHKEKLKTHR